MLQVDLGIDHSNQHLAASAAAMDLAEPQLFDNVLAGIAERQPGLAGRIRGWRLLLRAVNVIRLRDTDALVLPGTYLVGDPTVVGNADVIERPAGQSHRLRTDNGYAAPFRECLDLLRGDIRPGLEHHLGRDVTGLGLRRHAGEAGLARERTSRQAIARGHKDTPVIGLEGTALNRRHLGDMTLAKLAWRPLAVLAQLALGVAGLGALGRKVLALGILGLRIL